MQGCLFGGERLEVELETRPTNTTVGVTFAVGPAPDLQHQPPGLHVFFVKKVGLGIYQVYTHINVKIGISSGNLSKKILIHRISYRYTYAIQGLIGRGRSEIKTQN